MKVEASKARRCRVGGYGDSSSRKFGRADIDDAFDDEDVFGSDEEYGQVRCAFCQVTIVLSHLLPINSFSSVW